MPLRMISKPPAPFTHPPIPTQPCTLHQVVGVNGGGKTTTIGKLANKFASEGAKVRFTPLG